MKSKYKNVVLTGLFCGGLAAVFGLNLFLPDRDFSEQENRLLAQRPAFSFEDIKSGQYTEDMEKYLTDQFIGRDAWLGLKWFADLAAGKKESNGIYKGEAQTLIPALIEADKQRQATNIEAVKKLAKNLDTQIYFAIIPSSAEIWREKLPYGAPGIDQKQTIDALYQSVSKEATCIDLYAALDAKKDEPVFYRTDHHWTTLGAYYGYVSIMKALGMEPVRMADKAAQTTAAVPKTDEAANETALKVSEATNGMALKSSEVPRGMTPKTDEIMLQTVSDRFYGTSQSKSGARLIRADELQLWAEAQGSVLIDSGGGLKPAEIYDWKALEQKDYYKIFFGGNQPQMLLRNPNASGRHKLLVIKDSYANSMLPFMMRDFQEIHVLDMRFMKKSVSDYAKENGIDTTLVMYGLPNFLTDPNIGILM